MRISDWSSDVCSSDLPAFELIRRPSVKRWKGTEGAGLPRSDYKVGTGDQQHGCCDDGKTPTGLEAVKVHTISSNSSNRLERLEERRVGKEWDRACICGWRPDH